jgi:hypothetical protein
MFVAEDGRPMACGAPVHQHDPGHEPEPPGGAELDRRRLLATLDAERARIRATGEASGFDVTDPELDAPDGARVLFERRGVRWEPVTGEADARTPPPGTRLAAFAFDPTFRTADGSLLTIEWGDPDPGGWYSPSFTRHDDDNLVATERKRITEAMAFFGREYDVDGRMEWHSRNCIYRKTWAMGGNDEPGCAAVRAIVNGEEEPND